MSIPYLAYLCDKTSLPIHSFHVFLFVNNVWTTEYYVRLNNKGTESKLIPVVNWRNISHYLDRSSYDCRRQYMKVALDRDLERMNDIWTESEMVFLRQLVAACGTHWVEIARELGRKPVQCSNSFNNFYQITSDTSGVFTVGDIKNRQDSVNRDAMSDADYNHHESVNTKRTSEMIEPIMAVRKIVNRFSFWDYKEDRKLLDLGK